MIDELRAMAIFAHTVDEGSFRGAARVLGLSPSVVSHHVKHLEQRLGVALLYRSTRKLSLTHEGDQFYQSCQSMLQAASRGLEQVSQRSEQPSGRLILTLPAMFSQAPLMASLAEFARVYPKVELQLSFSDRAVDLISEGVDAAIRIGPLPDSALKARFLFKMPRVLVLSDSLYQQQIGLSLDHPNDLAQLPWIGLSVRKGKKCFVGPGQQRAELAFNSRVTVDDLHAQVSLAKAGMGLITPPVFMVQEDINSGSLVNPLQGWSPEPLDVFVVWPAQAKTKGLVQRLVEVLLQGVAVNK